MYKFWVLQKLAFRAALASLGNFSSKDKQESRKALLNVAGGAILVIIIAGAVVFVALQIANVGLRVVIPSIAIGISASLGLITAFFRAGGTLFSIKDWDFLSSLPVSKKTVVVSRLTNIYLSALGLGLIVGLPGLAIYYWYSPISFLSILYGILICVLTPIIPVAIGTFLSLIFTWIGSHFRRINVATGIVTLIALATFTIFYYVVLRGTMQNGLDSVQIGAIAKLFQPVNWAVNAIITENFGDFASFGLATIVLAIVVVELTNLGFYKINIRFQQKKTVGNYNFNEKSIKSSSQFSALVKKEFRMLINTPSIIGNSLFGVIMCFLIAGSFVILKINGMDAPTLFMSFVFGLSDEELAFSELSIPGFFFGDWHMQLMIVWMLCMFTMNQISACTVSLEGQSRWIPASLPITTKTYLLSKLAPSMIVYGTGFLVSSILLASSLQLGIVGTLLAILAPLSISFISTSIGFFLDVKKPNFIWKATTEVTKGGRAVGSASFSVIIVVVVGMTLTIMFGEIIAIMLPLVLFILGFILMWITFNRKTIF